VLADLEREGADLIVLAGDVVPGPLPEEVMARLDGLGLPLRWVRGNGERRSSHPDERLAEAVAKVEEQVVVGGHTHQQFDRRAGGKRVLNAGAVGMPYEGRPRAFWLLLRDGEPELRETALDLAAMAAAIRGSGYPDAEDLLRESYLEPVDADSVARLFEGQVV
jgi:predicted phosphodiesterase